MNRRKTTGKSKNVTPVDSGSSGSVCWIPEFSFPHRSLRQISSPLRTAIRTSIPSPRRTYNVYQNRNPGSKLALAQTSTVCKKLAALGIDTEQVIINTQGDTTTGVPLHEIGGQGVFVRALDDAILAGQIDCAVHSMKDIPTFRPNGLITAAVLKRDSTADYLAYNGSLNAVRVIGTSSTRRRAQLLRHDPEISIKDLRGNVDTRIRKMASR